MFRMICFRIAKTSLIFLLGISQIFAQEEDCGEVFDGARKDAVVQAQLKQEYLEYILEKYADQIRKLIDSRANTLNLQRDDHFRMDMQSAFFIRLHKFIEKDDGISKLSSMESEKGGIENYFYGILKHLSIDYKRSKFNWVSIDSVSKSNGETYSIEIADRFEPVSLADESLLRQAISFLPIEQQEIIELESLDNSEQSRKKLLEIESKNPLLFRERREFAYRNLDLYNQIAFNTSFYKANRRDNPNRRTVSIVWSEYEFYNNIAFLTEANRRVLSSYLVERLSAEEIKIKYGYQNILSVHKQLNRAMALLKDVAGLKERKDVRLDTIVVVLREEKNLRTNRRKFYEGADLIQIHEAGKYREFDPEKDMTQESLDGLLNLMHPIHAEVFAVLFKRSYTKEEALKFLGYNSLEKLDKIMGLAVSELSVLTKNPKFRRSLIKVLEAKFLKL